MHPSNLLPGRNRFTAQRVQKGIYPPLGAERKGRGQVFFALPMPPTAGSRHEGRRRSREQGSRLLPAIARTRCVWEYSSRLRSGGGNGGLSSWRTSWGVDVRAPSKALMVRNADRRGVA